MAVDSLGLGPDGHHHPVDRHTADLVDTDYLVDAYHRGPSDCSLASVGAVAVAEKLAEQLIADRQKL